MLKIVILASYHIYGDKKQCDIISIKTLSGLNIIFAKKKKKKFIYAYSWLTILGKIHYNKFC